MKLLFRILLALAALVILLLALAVGCVFLVESVGPGVAASRINAMTGFRLDVEKFRIGILDSSVEISGVQLKNPEGWPEDAFVTVNTVKGGVKPFSFIGDSKREIDEIVLDLGTINIVRNAKGETNALVFKNRLNEALGEGEEKPAEKPAEKEVAGEKAPVKFIIHHLVLKAGKVRVADYSGAKPRVVERAIPINLDLREVDSTQQIQSAITTQVVPQVLLMLGSIQLQLGGEKGADVLKGLPGQVQGQLGNLLNAIGGK